MLMEDFVTKRFCKKKAAVYPKNEGARPTAVV